MSKKRRQQKTKKRRGGLGVRGGASAARLAASARPPGPATVPLAIDASLRATAMLVPGSSASPPAAEASAAPVEQELARGAEPDREEPSVPPAGDLDVVLFDSPFFDSDPSPLFFDAVPDPFGAEFEADPEARRFTPEAFRRRAELAKYVRAAVGFSLALCLVALGKAAILRGGDGPGAARPSPRAFAATLADPPAQDDRAEGEPGTAAELAAAVDPATAVASAAAATAVDPATAVGPAAAVTAVDPATAVGPAADAATGSAVGPASAVVTGSRAAPAPAVAGATGVAAGSAEGAASGARTSARPSPPEAAASNPMPTAAGSVVAGATLDARTERERARGLLERGKVAEAIGAGERATRLDASDGEAWLILGAAYQEKGDLGEARRCFKTCAREGMRGPRTECAQMLR